MQTVRGHRFSAHVTEVDLAIESGDSSDEWHGTRARLDPKTIQTHRPHPASPGVGG